MGVLLAAFALAAPYAVPALVVLFLVSILASLLVINLQLRLMQVAGSAQTLGAASNHAALNLANALGAWLGGMAIAAGWGDTGHTLEGFPLRARSVGWRHAEPRDLRRPRRCRPGATGPPRQAQCPHP